MILRNGGLPWCLETGCGRILGAVGRNSLDTKQDKQLNFGRLIVSHKDIY